MTDHPASSNANLSQKAVMLRALPGFAALEPAVLEELATLCTVRPITRNTRLISRGKRPEALYLVLSGRFRVSTDGKTIAYLGAGEPIGELAFFAGGERTADVTALRNSVVLECTRAQYDKMAAIHPSLSATILASVAARLASVTAQAAPLPPQAGMITAVLGLDGAPLPEAFVAGLRAALAAHGDVVVLGAADLPAEMRRTGWAEWFSRAEQAGKRQVLLVEDAGAHPDWAGRATRHADSQFIVIPPDAPLPEGAPAQPGADADTGMMQLVLLRGSAAQAISGSRDWLRHHPAHLHHHVALDSEADHARLARFICDRACGLVLAGGGALATAHLGAVKALQEAGIAIDLMGGSSVGAAMAGALACGLAPDEILRRSLAVFEAQKLSGDLGAPMYALLDHEVFDTALQDQYGAVRIEDMPLNFFAGATSLSRNALDILREGPLWQAVRASAAIPVLLPPVISSRGEVYIDGGMIDNLPLEPMRRFKSGPNIALAFDLGREVLHEGAGRPVEKIARPLPAAPDDLTSGARMPRIATALARSMALNAARRCDTGEGSGQDAILAVPVPQGASFLDWSRAQEYFDLAYGRMTEALAATDEAGADPMARMRAVSAYLAGRSQAP